MIMLSGQSTKPEVPSNSRFFSDGACAKVRFTSIGVNILAATFLGDTQSHFAFEIWNSSETKV